MIDGWLEDLKPGYTLEQEHEMLEYATEHYHRLYLALKELDDRFYFLRTSCYLKFKKDDSDLSLFDPIIISWSSKWAHINTKAEFSKTTGEIVEFNAEQDIHLLDWADAKEIRKDWKDVIRFSCQHVYNACREAIRQEKENIKLAKQKEIREAAAQYEQVKSTYRNS